MGQNRGARGSKKTQAPTRNKKTQDACAKPVLAQAPKGNKETSEEAGKLVHREDHHKGVIGSIDPTSPAEFVAKEEVVLTGCDDGRGQARANTLVRGARRRWADYSSDSEDEGLWLCQSNDGSGQEGTNTSVIGAIVNIQSCSPAPFVVKEEVVLAGCDDGRGQARTNTLVRRTRQRWADCSSDSEDEGLWRCPSKAIPELILNWSDTLYDDFVLLVKPFMQDTELGSHKHLIGFDSNGCDREFTWEGNGEPQWARALDKNCFPLVIQGPTTVMLKDLPIDFSPSDILELLDGKGFKGKYDLSYAPPGRKAKGSAAKRGNSYQNKGFAFLNMVTHEAAVNLIDELTGFTQWGLNSNKVLKVVWADVQGLTRNIQKFRNFSMMEESFPALWRPMLFRDGEQIPFPAPTKLLKPPRHQSRRN